MFGWFSGGSKQHRGTKFEGQYLPGYLNIAKGEKRPTQVKCTPYAQGHAISARNSNSSQAA
jgi:hypothetical protein